MAARPGMLTKANPARAQRDASIAQGRLAGKTLAQLAREYGISAGQVSRVLHEPEQRAILEAGGRDLIAMVPSAVDVTRETMLSADNPELRYKAAQDILKGVGLAPSHATSPICQNIYNTQINNVIDPAVMQALAGFLDLGGDDDV